MVNGGKLNADLYASGWRLQMTSKEIALPVDIMSSTVT